MCNPESDAAICQSPVENSGVKSEFLGKVAEIPVVNLATKCSIAAYDKLKHMTRFTAKALSAAERITLYFVDCASTFFQEVEPEARFADKLACYGLDVFTNNMPLLMKTPNQLVEEVTDLYWFSFKLSYQKAKEMKIMGPKFFTCLENHGIQKITEVLVDLEDFVDNNLPPPFEEGIIYRIGDCKSVRERACRLAGKAGLRIFEHGVKQLEILYNKGSVSLELLLCDTKRKMNKNTQSFEQCTKSLIFFFAVVLDVCRSILDHILIHTLSRTIAGACVNACVYVLCLHMCVFKSFLEICRQKLCSQ